MPYTSKLIQEIITTDAGRRILGYISPIYGNARVCLLLFNAIGIELQEMNEWADEIILQIHPQTATWAIPLWEQEYGILPDKNISLSQRRDRILKKMKSRAPMNPKKMEKVVQLSTGYSVRVDENTGKNKFAVAISALPGNEITQAVMKVVDQVKPAHLIYTTQFEQGTGCTSYFGGYHVFLNKENGYDLMDFMSEALYKLHSNYLTAVGWVGEGFAEVTAPEEEGGSPDIVDFGNREMGFRLVPHRLEYDTQVSPGGTLNFMQIWSNTAVGRVWNAYSLKVYLTRADGTEVWSGVDQSFDPVLFTSGDLH